MKWGVRKAREMGGARGAKRLSRQYAKAQKKLAKLEKRAANSGKYARRAALMGAGAAAAGGLAIGGTSGVNKVLNRGGAALGKGGKAVGSALIRGGYSVGKFGNRIAPKNKITAGINKGMNAAGNALMKGGKAANAGMYKAGYAVGKWGNSNSIGKAVGNNKTISNAVKIGGRKVQNAAPGFIARATNGKGIVNTTDNIGKVTGRIKNNTIARIGAGVVGAGLAAGAAKNAYRAATAQKKAARFKSEMNKAFAGTQYANGGNRQGKKRKRR